MKINKSDFYTILFTIVILSQLYVMSFKINFYLQIVFLSIFLYLEKVKISKSFLKDIFPLFLILFIGFIGLFLNKYNSFNIIKDIIHFVKPILGLLIGYFYFKQINDFPKFIKTIVLIGFYSALIHIFLVVFISKHETVANIREYGKDNYLELFSILFLKYYKKFFNNDLFSKKHYQLYFYTILISCILYFSRTMIVVGAIMILSIHGYTKLTSKSLKIILLFLSIATLLFSYLQTIKLDRNGNSLESFLYKVQIAPSEIFKTKIDRDNHEQLWDHWRGYEAQRAFDLMNMNKSSYVFGCGYGSLVNLKFLAPLSDDKRGVKYISELHNGYPYILYKTGFIGLFLYLFFLIKLYLKTYQKHTFENLFISAIGISYMFTTLTITGIYNTSDVVVLILGALLFFKTNPTKTNNFQHND